MANSSSVCAVVGIGPGNGVALSKRWAAEGHPVAMLTRNEETLARYEREIPGTKGIPCDATDAASVARAFETIRTELGPVETLIYNAGSGVFRGLLDLDEDEVRQGFDVNCVGLYHAARQVVPPMVDAGRGTIAVIGASAAWRGRPQTFAFAAAKAGQRSMAQSLARDFGPQGIHTFYVVIDGMVDLPRTRKMVPDKPDDFFLAPDDIATTVWNVAQQPPSAWSFEVDLRPFGERW